MITAACDSELNWSTAASDKQAAGETPRASVSDDISPAVLKRAKGGSRDAFNQLVSHYEKRIFNYLNKMTGNAAEPTFEVRSKE